MQCHQLRLSYDYWSEPYLSAELCRPVDVILTHSKEGCLKNTFTVTKKYHICWTHKKPPIRFIFYTTYSIQYSKCLKPSKNLTILPSGYKLDYDKLEITLVGCVSATVENFEELATILPSYYKLDLADNKFSIMPVSAETGMLFFDTMSWNVNKRFSQC